MGILRAGLTGHFRGRTLPAHSTFILASGYLVDFVRSLLLVLAIDHVDRAAGNVAPAVDRLVGVDLHRTGATRFGGDRRLARVRGYDRGFGDTTGRDAEHREHYARVWVAVLRADDLERVDLHAILYRNSGFRRFGRAGRETIHGCDQAFQSRGRCGVHHFRP